MRVEMETLQKWKEGATIFSLVAVPIIVALGTLAIQKRIAEEGARKDYVTLAIGLLAKKKDEQPDIELRQWAVDVVDKNSPVPLTPSLKAKLSVGGVTFTKLYGSGVTFDDFSRAELAKAIEEMRKREVEKAPKDQ
jgi:hypothetical protein